MITLGGAPGSGRAAVAGTGPGAGASLASGSVRPGTHRCYGFRRLHESRISIRGAPFGAGTRSVDTQSGLLPEGWLRFEAPFGRACAPSVRPRESPSLEGLQEVMVVAEKRQVVQLGGSVLGEWDHMVDLQAERHPAPGHHADPVAMRQRRP